MRRSGRLCDWREIHSLDLREAVFLAQMTVTLHCQGAAVLVAGPFADGENFNAALKAGRDEKMPEVVMGERREAKFLAGCGEALLRALDSHDGIGWLGLAFGVKPGE